MLINNYLVEVVTRLSRQNSRSFLVHHVFSLSKLYSRLSFCLSYLFMGVVVVALLSLLWFI